MKELAKRFDLSFYFLNAVKNVLGNNKTIFKIQVIQLFETQKTFPTKNKNNVRAVR